MNIFMAQTWRQQKPFRNHVCVVIFKYLRWAKNALTSILHFLGSIFAEHMPTSSGYVGRLIPGFARYGDQLTYLRGYRWFLWKCNVEEGWNSNEENPSMEQIEPWAKISFVFRTMKNSSVFIGSWRNPYLCFGWRNIHLEGYHWDNTTPYP